MKLISIRKMKKRINVPANVKMGRICAIWLFCIALQAVSIPILAQSAKITLRLKNVTVEEVLTSIENQTEYRFLYNKDIVDVSRIVSISVKNELMTLVLDKLFKGEGVSYTIEKRQIVLNKVSSRAQDNKQPVKVTGKGSGRIRRGSSGSDCYDRRGYSRNHYRYRWQLPVASSGRLDTEIYFNRLHYIYAENYQADDVERDDERRFKTIG